MSKKVSLIDAVPDIETYWDYEANEGKKPSDFGASSSVKVWTKCPICGTSVRRNVRFTWEKDENGVGHIIHCRTCGKRNHENSLVKLFPDIKKYWIYEKNDHAPEYYTIASGKRVYTTCPECGIERFLAICDLVNLNNGRYELSLCQSCANKKKLENQKTILDVYPEIMKYWDDLNAYKPSELTIYHSRENLYSLS